MKVYAYRCPKCRYLVFSRARHDCRSCKCGNIYVDGGLDYNRIGWTDQKLGPPKPEEVEIRATKKDLYDDWNNPKGDKYGWIKPEGEEFEL